MHTVIKNSINLKEIGEETLVTNPSNSNDDYDTTQEKKKKE
jgi:hypothetical protein